MEFLREILNELQLDSEILPCNVPSNVSGQPVTSTETKRGSHNRAKHAFYSSEVADFAIGIEVGYQLNRLGQYQMLCWTTIVDRKGTKTSARSHALVLPQFHQQILKENKLLGDFVRQYLEENPNPLSQHIGIIIRDRKPFIQTSDRWRRSIFRRSR